MGPRRKSSVLSGDSYLGGKYNKSTVPNLFLQSMAAYVAADRKRQGYFYGTITYMST